jgi:iron complex transport system substrate-binding protein
LPVPLIMLLIALPITLKALATLGLWRMPDGRFVVDSPLFETRVSGETFPKRLIDPVGREQVLASAPRRIASAVLAGDEMLAALVDTERVVSVTFFADNPAISAAAGVFSDAIHRNHGGIEELLSLQPDLAVVAGYSNATTVRLLLRSGIAIVRLSDANSFAAVASAIETLAAAVGEPLQGAAIIADMRARIRAVQRAVAERPRPRVLYYALGGFTVGEGSLIDEMIALAGGQNVAREAGVSAHGRISAELAIALQPEVLLVSGWQDGQLPVQSMLSEQPGWRHVPAVRSGRVHALSGAWLTSVSQESVRGVEAIARRLHPDVFPYAGADGLPEGGPDEGPDAGPGAGPDADPDAFDAPD